MKSERKEARGEETRERAREEAGRRERGGRRGNGGRPTRSTNDEEEGKREKRAICGERRRKCRQPAWGNMHEAWAAESDNEESESA